MENLEPQKPPTSEANPIVLNGEQPNLSVVPEADTLLAEVSPSSAPKEIDDVAATLLYERTPIKLSGLTNAELVGRVLTFIRVDYGGRDRHRTALRRLLSSSDPAMTAFVQKCGVQEQKLLAEAYIQGGKELGYSTRKRLESTVEELRVRLGVALTKTKRALSLDTAIKF